jgi:hypothetical protein
MEYRDKTIRRIMLLSHERGKELGQEEVLRKARLLIRHLREREGIENANLDYALHYWQEMLENGDD